ncbi:MULTISPECIES: winged helix-turn-helix transcriptional regulator [unclassified Lysobacter]
MAASPSREGLKHVTSRWGVLVLETRVRRFAYEVIPPRVEYRLTPLGREAAEKVRALADWIEGSLRRILQAQEQRNRERAQA